MLVQEPIQAAIWHCLNNFAYEDATFLAERLFSEVNSEEALYLVAASYFRSGKVGRTHSILQTHGARTPQLKLLMAKCCYVMGKLDEAEAILTGGSILKPKKLDDLVTEYGSIACFALQLIGFICARTERLTRAIEALRRCVKLNPFLWHSFSSLCDFGDKPDPSKIFRLDGLDSLANCHGSTICSYLNTAGSHVGIYSETVNSTLGNVSINTPVAEPYIHPTPILHQHSHQFSKQIIPTITPVNNQLISHGNPLMTTPIQQTISSVGIPLHSTIVGSHTPVSITLSAVKDLHDSVDETKRKIGKFQSIFHRAEVVTPTTPSFGVLRFDDSTGSVELESNQSSTLAYLSLSPLCLSRLDAQSNNSKLPINLGKTLLNRNSSKESPLVINKPVVFAPAGNNSNYQSPQTGQANVRRSSRLFGNSNSVKENNKSHFVAPKSPTRKSKIKAAKTQSSLSELNEKNKFESQNFISSEISEKPVSSQSLAHQALMLQKDSAEGLMSLLRDIGAAYLHLAQYNCSKAIELFSALPPVHYSSSWVLSQVAKAHFEMASYKEAVKLFAEVRQQEPYNHYLIDYYSTALWHLQREVQLSALAQEAVEENRESPGAWCAVGNCFSLQKEHETAIKFFFRAVQVDPNFAYAYTLLGHEHLVTEELDQAMSCYRSAVRLNPRHYNAWYGIGLVLFKQERYAQAESYFRKALSIHPNCSVLLCHVAVVEHTLQKSNAALSTLNRALTIDPKNPLCKYHRACILHALDRHQEALEELLSLKEIVPKEANVYFMLGKVYKKLGDTHLALMNFSWAMDLDPKGASNQLKETIDPAMNGCPLEDEDSANNNPHENGSELSSCAAAMESSQESLILENTLPSQQRYCDSQLNRNPLLSGSLTGIEDPPLSSSLSVEAPSINDGDLDAPSRSGGHEDSVSRGESNCQNPGIDGLVMFTGSARRETDPAVLQTCHRGAAGSSQYSSVTEASSLQTNESWNEESL